MTLRLFSPAKINLFLRVMGRRNDGFHELASLFQAVDLGDFLTLSLTASSEDVLTCTDSSLPCNGHNLILKAAALFRRKTGLTFSLRAHLEKHIPLQSGFGGGSSNAATALWGINALCGFVATEKQLGEWAGEIGSDISFFFSLGSAYCTGRGEIVRTIPPLQQPDSLWLTKPSRGLSTPEVFRVLDVNELTQLPPETLLEGWKMGMPIFHNDLERPAFKILPALEEVKKSLSQMGSAMLSGSGTGFFLFGKRPVLPCTSSRFLFRKQEEWYAI